MVMKLHKKPIEVEGVRWTGDNVDEMRAFVGGAMDVQRCRCLDPHHDGHAPRLIIQTLEGDHEAVMGAVVVKGIKGEFYPVDPEIFPDTFVVEDVAALEALSASQRAELKDNQFAVPGKRKLPINDETHIRMAWNFLAHTDELTAEEKKRARGAILAAAKKHDMDTSDWKWPSLEAQADSVGKLTW